MQRRLDWRDGSESSPMGILLRTIGTSRVVRKSDLSEQYGTLGSGRFDRTKNIGCAQKLEFRGPILSRAKDADSTCSGPNDA